MVYDNSLKTGALKTVTVTKNDKEHKLISCVIMNTDIVASLLYDDIEESDIDNIYQEGYCFDAKIKSLDIKDDDIVYSILLSTKKEYLETAKGKTAELFVATLKSSAELAYLENNKTFIENKISSNTFLNFIFNEEEDFLVPEEVPIEVYVSKLTFKKIENDFEMKFFKNVCYNSCIKLLKKKKVGEFFFRPSIKGNKYYRRYVL